LNKFIKKLVSKFNLKFKTEFERQKKFFKKPDVLIALVFSALVLLDKLVKNKKSKQEIKVIVQNDLQIKRIIKYTTQQLSEEILNDLLLDCIDKKELPTQIPQDLSIESYITYAEQHNDIEEKTSSSNFFIEHENEIKMIGTYAGLLYLILEDAKELLTRTEHPSRYRTKYIQKLLRNTYASIKSELKLIKSSANNTIATIKISGREEIDSAKTTLNQEYNKAKTEAISSLEKIGAALKQIDNILIAVVMATTIYLHNRKYLQKKSTKTLQEISADVICQPVILEPYDVSVNRIPFKIIVDCPTDIDEVIVPHMPIEMKMANLSCEVVQNEEIIIDATQSQEIVTHAIIQNKRTKETLFFSTNKDSTLTQQTVIGNLGGKVVYSPIDGLVEEINANEIIIKDISEPIDDYLTQQINLLGEKYNELNNAKTFLKDLYITTLYPIMLSISITDDASSLTRNTDIGIENNWKSLKTSYDKSIKKYEKNVKKIAGKDNVEKHAKNETLFHIKDDLEKEEEKFYKIIKLLGEIGKNGSKKTKAKSSEYELADYYVLELGEKLNKVENPNKLEKEFRDKINNFIRQRIVLDGFNKSKISTKINALIKDIEKGISLGDWFGKAMKVYKATRKISDLKNWLTGLANKNTKLEDKIGHVNRVIYLFELYLEYDNIVQKYNTIKKETTSKKQTIIEGNYISLFMSDLWAKMDKLPIEIEQTQLLIDSLSLFQTYSIVEWNGYKARLYRIADIPECTSLETDPYLNPKSIYGYGDIQYWLKYCAFATLASVTNPLSGWSTGWTFPTPIPFPVVYVPAKSIPTKYGFIVLGLTICGIFIFPWSLFVNYSASYTTPFGDPTIFIKNEIDALKKVIAEQQYKFRKTFIKNILDETKEKLDDVNAQLKEAKQNLEKHKGDKPAKYPKLNDNDTFEFSDIETGVQKNINYAVELGEWVAMQAALREVIVTLSAKRWGLEKTYKILLDAQRSGKSVKGVDEGLESAEKLITAQLDKLTALADKADDILAPLPITLKPETANFGFTLKNPKPIINIASELADNINEGPLNKIFDKFRLRNENLMSSNYGSKLSGSILNYNSYKRALSVGMITIIKKDPFPKYELLKITNIPWVAFLYKDFVSTGAQTYGFPGFPPYPLPI